MNLLNTSGNVSSFINVNGAKKIEGKTAKHWVRTVNWQKNNLENLNNENIIATSYEELCLDIDNVIKLIQIYYQD